MRKHIDSFILRGLLWKEACEAAPTKPEQNTRECGRLSCYRCFRNLACLPLLIWRPYVASRGCPYRGVLQTA